MSAIARSISGASSGRGSLTRTGAPRAPRRASGHGPVAFGLPVSDTNGRRFRIATAIAAPAIPLRSPTKPTRRYGRNGPLPVAARHWSREQLRSAPRTPLTLGSKTTRSRSERTPENAVRRRRHGCALCMFRSAGPPREAQRGVSKLEARMPYLNPRTDRMHLVKSSASGDRLYSWRSSVTEGTTIARSATLPRPPGTRRWPSSPIGAPSPARLRTGREATGRRTAGAPPNL
jgi:hypothetical protein